MIRVLGNIFILASIGVVVGLSPQGSAAPFTKVPIPERCQSKYRGPHIQFKLNGFAFILSKSAYRYKEREKGAALQKYPFLAKAQTQKISYLCPWHTDPIYQYIDDT